jgi:hypothetical protein
MRSPMKNIFTIVLMTQQPTPVGGNLEGALPPAIILSHWYRYWVLIILTFLFSFDNFFIKQKNRYD